MDPIFLVAVLGLVVVLVTTAATWGYYFHSLSWRRHPLRWGIGLALSTGLLIAGAVSAVVLRPYSRSTVILVIGVLHATWQTTSIVIGGLRRRPDDPPRFRPDWRRAFHTYEGRVGLFAVAVLCSGLLLAFGAVAVRDIVHLHRGPGPTTLTFHNDTLDPVSLFSLAGCAPDLSSCNGPAAPSQLPPGRNVGLIFSKQRLERGGPLGFVVTPSSRAPRCFRRNSGERHFEVSQAAPCFSP